MADLAAPPSLTFHGRGIVAGAGAGPALVALEPISFFGDVDIVTGRVTGSADANRGASRRSRPMCAASTAAASTRPRSTVRSSVTRHALARPSGNGATPMYRPPRMCISPNDVSPATFSKYPPTAHRRGRAG